MNNAKLHAVLVKALQAAGMRPHIAALCAATETEGGYEVEVVVNRRQCGCNDPLCGTKDDMIADAAAMGLAMCELGTQMLAALFAADEGAAALGVELGSVVGRLRASFAGTGDSAEVPS